ncbi:MAG TPA: copper resistance CopC family protein [Candidatus Limnocylindrales bacterium]
MSTPRARMTVITLLALVLVALAAPAGVAAHAELETASPPVGATVETLPTTVSATFSLPLLPDKSSIVVRDPAGDRVASGGVDPADPRTLSTAVPLLTAGTYQVRWTAGTDDGHVERGRYTFTVAANASPAVTPTPMPTATAAASLEPSASPTSTATASAEASASPAASPTGGDGGTSGESEPIGQLVVVAIVGIGLGLGLGWWRSRRPA